MKRRIISSADIESLERSVVTGVAPERMVEIGAWLVPIDDGAIGRAKSAVPLQHAVDPATIAEVEDAYRAAGRPPAFRLAETEGLAAVRAELLTRGYVDKTPTIMKTGSAAGLIALSDRPAELLAQPDPAWIAAFTGEGFDPVESAARLRNLARSPDVLFAGVRDGQRTVAVGVVTFGHGWAGIHGIRTAPDYRRQGLARRVLAAFGAAAAGRQHDRVVLQVKQRNPSRRLYRQAGFAPVWRFRYWSRG